MFLFCFFFLQRKMQVSCMSDHNMRTVKIECMQLAKHKHAKQRCVINAGMICPFRCHEEMDDAIKEPARVSLLCAH